VQVTRPRVSKLMGKHNALARRLLDRQDDDLRFTLDPRVPFDKLLRRTVRPNPPSRTHRPHADLQPAAPAYRAGEYIRHYNARRPHRARDLRPPQPTHPVADLLALLACHWLGNAVLQHDSVDIVGAR
jgi:hypothetical protein